MATRGIIVRTRDLPSAALSPSQRAAEVAMATDRRKPAPTLLFPRMRTVGFAVSRSLCVKWFCCAVLQLPPRHSSFFSPRIPFPSVFPRGRCARRHLFVRSSESQTSSRTAALGDPVCRGSFRRRRNFRWTKERTILLHAISSSVYRAGFARYVSGMHVIVCMKVREHKIWHERKHYFLHFYFLRIKYSSLNRKMLWMVRMVVHRFKRYSILISGCIRKINLNSINRFLAAVKQSQIYTISQYMLNEYYIIRINHI